MKNVRLLFVLLLIVNCTTDLPDVEETSELLSPQTQSCVDELPKVRITNNGTANFDLIVYGLDYTQLYTQNVSTAANSGWLELSNHNVVVVASDGVNYGQKIELNLASCDNVELEMDVNNTFVISGD